MPKTDDVELLARWRAEYRDAVEAQITAQMRANALQKMIEGFIELHPELDKKDSGVDFVASDGTLIQAKHFPVNVADVVREILRDNPETWYTSGQMVKAVTARGVEATHTAIRLALRRTGEKGYSDKRGEGKGQTFRFRAEPAPDELRLPKW